jgi:hypothetical protein
MTTASSDFMKLPQGVVVDSLYSDYVKFRVNKVYVSLLIY